MTCGFWRIENREKINGPFFDVEHNALKISH
jgi:hypothetical protein